MIAKIAIAAATVAGLSTAATAADLIVDTPVASAPAVSDWDGFYVGVFGGYAKGVLTTTDNLLPISPYDENYEGYLLGVQGGYNFHITDNIVGGFSTDIAFNNAEADEPSYALSIDWSGSATARIGIEMGSVVPYVLGGISAASASIKDMSVAPADQQVHAGYVLGVGGEVSLTENVSANVEYRYTNYGTKIYDLYNPTPAELVDSSVRGGLNFRF